MIKMLKVVKNNKPMLDYFNLRLKNNKLIKKAGDDKLVISLVLIAVGVALCFIYRNQINEFVTAAMGKLTTKLGAMFESSPDPNAYTSGVGTATP